MDSPVSKIIGVILILLLFTFLLLAILAGVSFHDHMRDLGFSDKECAGWGNLPMF